MEAPQLATHGSTRGGSRVLRVLKGGTEGNARLTALTAVLLLALLAVEGVTILAIRPLLSLHVFVGLLLIPPVLLKLAATGYRFVRYYRRDKEYVLKGPPILLMRMLVAPALVAATVGVFATGVALLVVGPEGGIVLGLHKASFVIWGFAFGVHVLAYVSRVPSLVRAEWSSSTRAAGTGLRYSLVGLTLVTGLIIAFAALPAAHAWLHAGRFDR
jgi:hypothetical protein